MRLIHKVPFSSSEIEYYRQLVFDNLTRGLCYLLDAMQDMDLKVSDDNLAHLDLIDGTRDIRDGEPFPLSYYGPLKSLWNDPNVRKAWERGNEAALPEKYVLILYHALQTRSSHEPLISQPVIFLHWPGQAIWPCIFPNGARHSSVSCENDWYHGDNLFIARSWNVNGGRRWAEKRATKMDTLFSGCYQHPLPRQSEWLRSVPSRGQRCGAFLFLPSPLMKNSTWYLRIKCKMLWQSGTQYATHSGSNKRQLSIISLLIRAGYWYVSFDQILFLNKNDLFEKKIPTSDIKSFFPVSLSLLWLLIRAWVDADGISIRILTVNREMPELVEITSSDDSQSLHRKLVVLRNEKFISSKPFHLSRESNCPHEKVSQRQRIQLCYGWSWPQLKVSSILLADIKLTSHPTFC